MPRVNVYLSEEEAEYVKSRGRGYMRSLVNRDMLFKHAADERGINFGKRRCQYDGCLGVVDLGKCLTCGRR